jgi:hypothetical protein
MTILTSESLCKLGYKEPNSSAKRHDSTISANPGTNIRMQAPASAATSVSADQAQARTDGCAFCRQLLRQKVFG